MTQDDEHVQFQVRRGAALRPVIKTGYKFQQIDALPPWNTAGFDVVEADNKDDKMSRHIVDWSRQFEKPCIVFEDLKEMRDSIDYGTRMNRRLHHLTFRALQFYTCYKASFEGIPTAWIDPAYTSQRCPMCGHTERANRHKKRFKCKDCSHQDHSDRGASVNIAVKGIKKHQDWNVPALNSLPTVRTV